MSTWLMVASAWVACAICFVSFARGAAPRMQRASDIRDGEDAKTPQNLSRARFSAEHFATCERKWHKV
jgi:hypothetical protein